MTWPTRATPLDRARTIARTYRAALAAHDPNTTHRYDNAARAAGEHWITDTTTGPAVCTTQEAALLLGVTDRRIRQLIASGELPTAAQDRQGHLLRVDDVHHYQTTRHHKVAHATVSAVPSQTSTTRAP